MAQYNRFYAVDNSKLNRLVKEIADANHETAQKVQEYGNKVGGVAHFFNDSHGFAGFEFPAGLVPHGWHQVRANPDLFVPPEDQAEELTSLGELTPPEDVLRHFGLAGYHVQSKDHDNAIAQPQIMGDFDKGPAIVVVPWDEEDGKVWNAPEDWQEIDFVQANKIMHQLAVDAGQVPEDAKE